MTLIEVSLSHSLEANDKSFSSSSNVCAHDDDDDDDDAHFRNLLNDLFENEKEEAIKSSADPYQSIPIPFNDPKRFPRIKPAHYYQRERAGRRRRSIAPNYMPEIRILRRDIRRRYAEMFINVANNHDLTLMEKFFEEFCRPDCKVVRVLSPNEQFEKTMKLLTLKNIDHTVSDLKDMIHAFAFNYEMMPDTIFRLTGCQVRARQGVSGSVVIAKSRVKGTRLFIAEESTISNEESSSSSDDASYSSNCSSPITTPQSPLSSSLSSLVSPSPYNNNIESSLVANHRHRWIPVTPPVETSSEGFFILMLDQTHHIQQFHFEFITQSEKPIVF